MRIEYIIAESHSGHALVAEQWVRGVHTVYFLEIEAYILCIS